MIKKIFYFIKKAVCVAIDILYAIFAFIFNGIKKFVLMIVGLIKQ